MKKFLTMMCAVLALSFIFCTSGTVTEAKTAAYTSTITKDYRINWSNGTKKIYLNKKGNKLYCKNLKTGKTQFWIMGKLDEAVSGAGDYQFPVPDLAGHFHGSSAEYVYQIWRDGSDFWTA